MGNTNSVDAFFSGWPQKVEFSLLEEWAPLGKWASNNFAKAGARLEPVELFLGVLLRVAIVLWGFD